VKYAHFIRSIDTMELLLFNSFEIDLFEFFISCKFQKQ
jgi:hypothetical protein